MTNGIDAIITINVNDNNGPLSGILNNDQFFQSKKSVKDDNDKNYRITKSKMMTTVIPEITIKPAAKCSFEENHSKLIMLHFINFSAYFLLFAVWRRFK
jgi:hypothetical protein